MFVMLAVQPACVPVPVVMAPRVLPVVAHHAAVPAVGGLVHDVVVTYLSESEKYASSAVTRLRRSDFMDAAYAFCLVLANFGIAIAARMPMITTTINSSMSVKPLRFMRFPLSSGCLHEKRLVWAPLQATTVPFFCGGHKLL